MEYFCNSCRFNEMFMVGLTSYCDVLKETTSIGSTLLLVVLSAWGCMSTIFDNRYLSLPGHTNLLAKVSISLSQR